jgi:HAMP domain-containing protein
MDRNRDLTRLLASQFSVELMRYADQLAELGPDVVSVPRAARQAVLDAAAARLTDFDAGVVVLDRDGQIVAASRDRSELVGQNWANRSYFRRIALDRNRVLLSDIQNDGPSGSQSVAVAIPLLSPNRQLAGLLVGMFKVGPLGASALSRSLLRLDLRPETQVALVDSQGRAIYHHEADLLGHEISGQPAVQAARAGQVGALRSRDPEGHEIIASFAPVPGTLCGLIEEESWAELRQVSAGYGRTLLALLALGIILPMAVVAWALGRTTRPIQRVTQAVRAMAMGDLSQRINPPGEDELGELARAFNHMCAELELMYTDLEGQVEVRTRHLATINAVTSVTSRSLDLAEILHAALGTVLGAMGFEAGVAYRLLSDEDVLLLISSRGLSEESERKVRRLPLEALASKAQLSKGPLVRLVADYPPQELRGTLEQEGWRMAISVPLLARGELLGVMNLRALTPRPVTPEELTLLAAIGEQVGVALENARLYERAGEVAVAAERSHLLGQPACGRDPDPAGPEPRRGQGAAGRAIATHTRRAGRDARPARGAPSGSPGPDEPDRAVASVDRGDHQRHSGARAADARGRPGHTDRGADRAVSHRAGGAQQRSQARAGLAGLGGHVRGC